jgi:WD40 repeat protein
MLRRVPSNQIAGRMQGHRPVRSVDSSTLFARSEKATFFERSVRTSVCILFLALIVVIQSTVCAEPLAQPADPKVGSTGEGKTAPASKDSESKPPVPAVQSGTRRNPNPLIRELYPPDANAPLDAAGNLMPTGMMQRLGSNIFRVPAHQTFGFSADGNWLWIQAGNRVSVVHRETGKIVKQHQLRLDDSNAWTLSVSTDGTRIAIGMPGPPPEVEWQTAYRVVILSTMTTAHVQEIEWSGPAAALSCLSFSSDNQKLLSGTSDGDLRVWNVENGRQLRQVSFINGSLTNSVLSPDGHSAVITTRTGAFLWKLDNEAPKFNLTHGYERSACFAPNGRVFATAAPNGAFIWDTATGKLVAHLKSQDVEQYVDWSDYALAFSPDGRVLAVPALSSNTVELWDVETRKRIATLPLREPSRVAISQDGRWLAAAGNELGIKIFDLQTRQQVVHDSDKYPEQVFTVHFTGPNTLVTSGIHDARVWEGEKEFRTYKQTHTLVPKDPAASLAQTAVSPDGLLVAANCNDDTIRVWDRAAGTLRFKVQGHGTSVGAQTMRFSPDSKQFVSWGDDKTLRLWNTQDGSLIAAHQIAVPGFRDPARPKDDTSITASFTFDLKSLFVCFRGVFYEFDTATGQRKRKVGFPREFHSLTISPDDHWIAMVETSPHNPAFVQRVVLLNRLALNIVREWPVSDPRNAVNNEQSVPDAGAGQKVGAAQTVKERAPQKAVSFLHINTRGMKFSPDSKLLAWGRLGPHPGIDVVEVDRDRLLASIPVESPCWCLDFSPDGKRIISGHQDSTLSLWNRFHPVFVSRPTALGGQSVDHNRKLRVRVVDKKDSTPLAGVVIAAERWEGPRQYEIAAVGTTDDQGFVEFNGLERISYRCHLAAVKPLPYIPTTHHSDSDLNEMVIPLNRACELTLRAVDEETGEGIAGVLFGRENAAGEYWLQDIVPDTLDIATKNRLFKSVTSTSVPTVPTGGQKSDAKSQPSVLTDANGNYRCLVSSYPWSYSVAQFPPGYNSVVPINGLQELEIQTPSGGRVEYTFRLRKAKSK